MTDSGIETRILVHSNGADPERQTAARAPAPRYGIDAEPPFGRFAWRAGAPSGSWTRGSRSCEPGARTRATWARRLGGPPVRQTVRSHWLRRRVDAWPASTRTCRASRALPGESRFSSRRRRSTPRPALAVTPSILVLVVGGIVAVFAAWLMSRRLVEPLRALEVAAYRAATGSYVKPIVTQRDDEIGQVADAFNAVALRLNALHDLSQLLASASRLDQVLDGILSAMGHIVGPGVAAIYLLDDTGRWLVPAAVRGADVDDGEPDRRARRELARRVTPGQGLRRSLRRCPASGRRTAGARRLEQRCARGTARVRAGGARCRRGTEGQGRSRSPRPSARWSGRSRPRPPSPCRTHGSSPWRPSRGGSPTGCGSWQSSSRVPTGSTCHSGESRVWSRSSWGH